MGMAGGLILSNQSVSADNNAREEANFGTYLAAHSCGGNGGGCSSRGGNSGSGQPQGNSSSQNQPKQAYHSCGGQAPSNQPNGAYSASCGSCGSHRSAGSETADAWPVEHSCGNQRSSYYHNEAYDQYQTQPNYYGDQQAQNHYQQGCQYQSQSNQGQRPSNWNQTQRSQAPQASSVPYYNPGKTIAEGPTTTTQKTMTESDLLNQLNAQGKATYQSLSPEGKALALKLANQTCKAHNECKGLNSCKTDTNSCAGQGGCKGKSPGPFADKNSAVKVAAQKMAEKRSNANKGNSSGKLNK